MRRVLFAVGLVLVAACGIGVVGERDVTDAGSGPDATTNPTPLPEGSPIDEDGGADAADAGIEAGRPDAGVVFEPTHIGASSYRLDQPAASIVGDALWVIDTTALTIAKGTNSAPPPAGAGVADPGLVADGATAVWSVGSLAMDNGGSILVQGSRPLAIVSASTVSMKGGSRIAANAAGKTPGAGGNSPTGVGGTGAKAGGKGGGGGGGGAPGGKGNDNIDGLPIAGGVISNADGAMLVGGASGGGSGVAGCGMGHGGGGGGAIQISAVGAMSFEGGAIVQVTGGGGEAGCMGGPNLSGGGGGGAGGLIYLETASTLSLTGGAEMDARGGAGGEGGIDNKNGNPGENPNPNGGLNANGGTGTNGGGDGGKGGRPGFPPEDGYAATFTGGGGGGSGGSVVLRSRGGTNASIIFDRAYKTDGAPF